MGHFHRINTNITIAIFILEPTYGGRASEPLSNLVLHELYPGRRRAQYAEIIKLRDLNVLPNYPTMIPGDLTCLRWAWNLG